MNMLIETDAMDEEKALVPHALLTLRKKNSRVHDRPARHAAALLFVITRAER